MKLLLILLTAVTISSCKQDKEELDYKYNRLVQEYDWELQNSRRLREQIGKTPVPDTAMPMILVYRRSNNEVVDTLYSAYLGKTHGQVDLNVEWYSKKYRTKRTFDERSYQIKLLEK